MLIIFVKGLWSLISEYICVYRGERIKNQDELILTCIFVYNHIKGYYICMFIGAYERKVGSKEGIL